MSERRPTAAKARKSRARTVTPTSTDWTADRHGVSNASPLYVFLVDEVDRIIRESGSALVNGRSLSVAKCIVSTLAHAHSMAPVYQLPAAKKE